MRQSLQSAIRQLETYLAKLRVQPHATTAQIAGIERMIAELRDEAIELELKEAMLPTRGSDIGTSPPQTGA